MCSQSVVSQPALGGLSAPLEPLQPLAEASGARKPDYRGLERRQARSRASFRVDEVLPAPGDCGISTFCVVRQGHGRYTGRLSVHTYLLACSCLSSLLSTPLSPPDQNTTIPTSQAITRFPTFHHQRRGPVPVLAQIAYLRRSAFDQISGISPITRLW